MRRWLGLTAALLIGCSSNETKGPPAKSASKGKLGISILTARNPFFNVIADTFKAEGENAGYEVVVVSGENDPVKQQNQVRDFLVQKTRAIVLCPCDARAVGAAIREANAAGVPVFTADLACLDPEAKVVSHIATDNHSGGREAAKAMIEALGDAGGKVGVLDYKEAESCIQRVKGFKEAIAEHNASAKAKLAIVAELPCGGDREKGFKSTQDLLTSHPDLAGLFAINDPAALGAWVAIDNAKKTAQVKLVGFDGQPDGKAAIRDGKIYADPIQHPDEIARKTFAAVQKYFAGEKLPAEILIPTALYRKADADRDPELKR